MSEHHFISTELPLRLGACLRIETVDAFISHVVSDTLVSHAPVPAVRVHLHGSHYYWSPTAEYIESCRDLEGFLFVDTLYQPRVGT